MSQQIEKITIKNFKNLDHKEVNLQGKNVYLIGPNQSGKTSFIQAAFGEMPKKPLKDGERKGEVIVELNDYTLEFRFNSKNQKAKLNIFDKSGEPQKAPATLFSKLFGVKDFNIDKFLSLSTAQKIEQIKDIIGIDWTDIDARYKELYDERRLLNRQVKEIDGEIADRPYDTKFKTIDTAELRIKIDKAIKTNSNLDRVEQGVEDRIAKIKELEQELATLKKEVKDGEEYLQNHKKIDVSQMQEELEKATEHNAKASENERIGQLRDKSSNMWKQIDEIEKEMEHIKETKKKELEAAKMPVEGLTFDDENLYLDGQPFESDQINTARRIVAGLEIQYHLLNEVKIARFDGSLLDKNSTEHVIKWAKERGLQLFIELVDRDGDELKIEVNEE